MGKESVKVKVDERFCKGCGLCVNICPHHLLQRSVHIGATGHHPVELINSEKKCIGCALCALVCPDTAIIICRKNGIDKK